LSLFFLIEANKSLYLYIVKNFISHLKVAVARIYLVN
jgi:hypothetical protein